MQTQLENAIQLIESDFMSQSQTVLKQAANVKTMLDNNSNEEIFYQIENIERIVDSFEVKIEDAIIRCIVLYSPKASDLRKLMAIYDMATYVERIGDLWCNIREFLGKTDIHGSVFTAHRTKLEILFDMVIDRTKNAIFAFSYKDVSLAKKTIISDDDVDNLHSNIVNSLGSYKLDKITMQQEIKDILYLSNLSYNLERIGDHSSNIAESALFLMEGINIKHSELCKNEGF